MGLRFPDDLHAWRRWQKGRQPLRAALDAVRHRGVQEGPTGHLLLPAEEPNVLVVIDVWSPSCKLVISDPTTFLDARRTAVLTTIPGAVTQFSEGREDLPFEGVRQLPTSIESVVSLGAFLGLTERVETWAKSSGLRFVVVQHGLMTPWAPPLNEGDHLLAWSEADAHFWTADRPGITWEVVGSQMLWNASQQPAAPLVDERPIMLGQLHGIEMGRSEKQAIYTRFCRVTNAQYRPHPNERDAVSRAQHRLMRTAGVEFESSGESVTTMGRPVVSIFSTGTIEAAQRGLPAWVHHPNPPAWLKEFWSRYGLSPYRGRPTAPMPLPALEPAAAIAHAMQP